MNCENISKLIMWCISFNREKPLAGPHAERVRQEVKVGQLEEEEYR